MKRTIIGGTVVVVLASMLLLGTYLLPAPTVQAQGGCSLATLQGDYLIHVRRDAPAYAHEDGFPDLVVGVTTFDGEGNLSLDFTLSRGGQISRRVRQVGVYTLDADCTGTMTNAGLRNWDLFVTNDGSEGAAIRTDDGVAATQTLKKR